VQAETRAEHSLDRMLSGPMLSRVTGSAAVPGNRLTLLRDGRENYPAWLDAIGAARRRIDLENYIIYDDATGRQFVAQLAERAKSGVRVRFLYDWMGGFGKTSRSLLAPLLKAGAEVRCFNPPRLAAPFAWFSRNHRKTLSVDGRIGFVSGLCIGDAWMGAGRGNAEAWRDTGVRIEGPAVRDLEIAFSHSWSAAGPPSGTGDYLDEPFPSPGPSGNVPVRLIEGQPAEMGTYRLDLLIAAGVQDRLWLTDAYFVGTTAYTQALTEAARDGVDVRLLVPGTSDLPLTQALSRASYRPLLEQGVRIFEWNGPMLHAKTAVADGHWARVGSTNLNLASWIGNWELDLAVEHRGFAEAMEQMYLEDLSRSTEIVLGRRQNPKPVGGVPPRRRHARRRSAARVAAGGLSIGNAIGAAIRNRRTLGSAEAGILAGAGLFLFVLSLVAVFFPLLIAVPAALLALTTSIALLLRAWRLHRRRDG
jgi:cardiolipin synthase A/B